MVKASDFSNNIGSSMLTCCCSKAENLDCAQLESASANAAKSIAYFIFMIILFQNYSRIDSSRVDT